MKTALQGLYEIGLCNLNVLQNESLVAVESTAEEKQKGATRLLFCFCKRDHSWPSVTVQKSSQGIIHLLLLVVWTALSVLHSIVYAYSTPSTKEKNIPLLLDSFSNKSCPPLPMSTAIFYLSGRSVFKKIYAFFFLPIIFFGKERNNFV